MKNIIFNNKKYIVFNDSEKINFDDLKDEDKSFLLDKKLIIFESFTTGKIKFVGNVMTPSTNFFSLPKNIAITENSIKIISKILLEYKNLKRNNTILFTNQSFSISKKGEIKSEEYYFNKLLKYFLDFITYEFYYKKERKIIHTTDILKGEILPFETQMNEEELGPGITYRVKDLDETKFGDIYYSTLKDLADKYASDKENTKIENMLKYLKSRDYNIKYSDINDDEKLKEIKKTIVNDIHQPIKKILIALYEKENLENLSTINVFYSSNFAYVWEHFMQKVLKHSSNFEEHFGKKIKPVKYKIHENVQDDPEFEGYKDIKPDIFSKNDNKLFIGDAKYYNKLDSNYSKEQFEYNIAFENKYPMIIFAPSNETKYYTKKTQNYKGDIFELLIIQISVEDVIKDILNKTTITLDKIYNILPKHTKRQFIF